MQLTSKSISFDTISIGDTLTPLIKAENQDSINEYDRLNKAAAAAFQKQSEPDSDPSLRDGWANLHTDEEFAKDGLFGTTVNMGVATVAYISEMLEQTFPATALLNGGSLDMKAIAPVRSGDTITISGEIVDKRVVHGKHLVECAITGINQENATVTVATAVLVV